MKTLGVDEGSVVEVWDQALGEWIRARVSRMGTAKVVLPRYRQRLNLENKGITWRHPAPNPRQP